MLCENWCYQLCSTGVRAPQGPGVAHVHEFGNFCSSPVGIGGLVVSTTHFPIPDTDSQSLKLA